jgi:hypothetical protein
MKAVWREITWFMNFSHGSSELGCIFEFSGGR